MKVFVLFCFTLGVLLHAAVGQTDETLELTTTLSSRLQDGTTPEDESELTRVNGGQTVYEPVPYQVSLQAKRRRNWQHICGGAVIGPRHVLTAAHCMQRYNISDLTLVVGTVTWRHGGQRHQVIASDVHPGFSMQPSVVNDIAVLTTHPPFDMRGGAVRAIPLARPYKIGANVRVRLTGWGSTTSGGTGAAYSIPPQLQSLAYATITNAECRQRGFRVNPSELCAYAGKGRGACVGDSGGPLVTEADSQLVGLVSYGTATCAQGRPDVYTRVSSFLPYINKVITAQKP